MVKATIALHNYLLVNQSNVTCNYCPYNYIDQEGPNGIHPGHWREEVKDIGGVKQLPFNMRGSNNYSKEAKQVRDDFRAYFNSEEGSVEWQNDITNATINPLDLR